MRRLVGLTSAYFVELPYSPELPNKCFDYDILYSVESLHDHVIRTNSKATILVCDIVSYEYKLINYVIGVQLTKDTGIGLQENIYHGVRNFYNCYTFLYSLVL